MILIVAPQDDLHAQGVVSTLLKWGIDVEWVDLAHLADSLKLTFEVTSAVEAKLKTPNQRTIRLGEVSTVWWRRPRHPKTKAKFPDEISKFIVSEWEQFLENLESIVQTRWINSPQANRIASRKVFQLSLAQSIGMRVPKTLVTNDAAEVQIFAGRYAQLIYKRIGVAPKPITATKMLQTTDYERLEQLQNCPAIFQEHIPAKYDIRVTVIGDQLFSAEIDSQAGSSPLDWRFDHLVSFRQHQLDQTVAKQILSLMRLLNLQYGAIDLRISPEGEYVFLEINPNGQYLFLELLTELPLTQEMANFLVLS